MNRWILACILAFPRLLGAAEPVEVAAFEYRVIPNVVYRTLPNWSGQLDLYLPPDSRNRPNLLWIHGGGWTRSSKEQEILYILPYIAEGWSVVAIEYRLASTAVAPGAIEDCRCALSWIVDNAASYGLSTTRLVVSGISAGGHLALTTAGLATSLGPCRLPDDFKPAAVLNWFGPSDLMELAFGDRPFDQAVEWMAGQQGTAVAVSPLFHVTKQSSPTLTIHGDNDDVIPYSQSVRLHEAFSAAGVPNELLTIEGAGHGDFSADQVARAYDAIRAFLRAHVLQAETVRP